MYLLIAVGAALSYIIGGTFMQLSEGFTKVLPSLLIFPCFCLGATLQTLATRQTGMGLTYIFILGLEAILAVLASILLFQEKYSMLKLLGIALATLGVALLRYDA